jgi:predicted nucleotidyltransferase
MWDENRDLLIRGARALRDLREEFVFVGGCTTGLLISDPAASDVRPTRDVDVIAEIVSRSAYYALSKRLRSLGFREDPELICRWQHKDEITLDVMPTDPNILGFSNPWYSGAIATATDHELEQDLIIRVVTPPYFCATKITAFHGRGKGDYAASHDLEDFLSVVDGRMELVRELRAAEEEVRRYVATEVGGFLRRYEFVDMLPGALTPDAASQARLPLLMARLDEIASI